MNHAGAENFNPTSLLAHRAAFAPTFKAADVDFDARFGEREIRRFKTDFTGRTEELLDKKTQSAFQIGHRNIRTDNQAFELHELMRMGRIVVVAPVHFSRAKDFDGFAFASSDLQGRSLGTQK